MKQLSAFACFLAILVIALGAYTRLKDAGLGCPDWPGCYGHLIVPNQVETIMQAQNTYHQMVEPQKAWLEMIHRYVAGSLGLCILLLALLSFKSPKTDHKKTFYALLMIGIVIFQALLGMWTVTLKLSPPIIMLHLYGGFTLLALLWWYHLSCSPISIFAGNHNNPLAKWIILSIVILLIQIGLGALTSSNYAAMICPDFPYCQGQWLPTLHLAGLFSIDIVRDNHLLVSLHMLHRIGALMTGSVLLILAFRVYLTTSEPLLKNVARLLFALVLAQITLGILNIKLQLPTGIAVGHNLTAALLLMTLLTLLFYSPLYKIPRSSI